MASERTRQIAGAGAGVVVGAGAAAGAGYVARRALLAAASRAPIAAVLTNPLTGVLVGSALAGAAAMGAYKAGKAIYDEGGGSGRILKGAALGALGISSAQAQEMTRPARQPAPAKQPGPVPQPIPPVQSKKDARLDRRTQGKVERAADQAERDVGAGKVDQAPKGDKSLWSDVKEMFKPNPEFAARRKGLEDERSIIQKQMAKGVDRGAGIKPETQAALEKNTKALQDLAKEERDSNVFKVAFQTFAPIGAALGGLAAGGAVSGASKVVTQGKAATREIAKLASQADKLTSKPGLLAGTVQGDRARAAVEAGKTAVAGLGKAHPSAYAWPVFNIAAGGAEMAYGFTADREQPMTQAARIAGGFELGLGIGQLKAVTAAAGAVRASATSLAKLGAAERRIARETAHGGMAASRATVGRNVGEAVAAKRVAGNQAAARVSGSAVTRDNAAATASKAGAQLGMTRAKSGSDVAVARNVGTRRVVESRQDVTAARNGKTLSRPDGDRVARRAGADPKYQPTRGRYFQRTYTKGIKAGITETVRKPSAG